jgi:triosephosphate isomerase
VRVPLVAANFKMHMTATEVAAYCEDLRRKVAGVAGVEIAIAPPFTALDRAAAALRGSEIRLAAQNVNAEPRGAFTGEISAAMLADAGCRYAIVGHSERRALYGETDAGVAAKAVALLAAGLRPILCVGESLEEREAGRTVEVVEAQLAGSLAAVAADRIDDVVIAYEPVWAIGTGRTATPALAQDVHAAIRARLARSFGAGAEAVRIQYGGSVKPENAGALVAQPDIDGALVGGASLDPTGFAVIVRAAAQARRGRSPR